jgi:hypothetical protein
MQMDASKVKGFVLRHKIKDKETETRFGREEYDLFKQWVDICRDNRYEHKAYAIDLEDNLRLLKPRKKKQA